MPLTMQCKKCGKEYEIPLMPGAFLEAGKDQLCPQCRVEQEKNNGKDR